MSGSPFGILETVLGFTQQQDTKSATESSINAQNRAQDVSLQMYNQNRADQMPWLTAGQNAMNRLGTMTSEGGSLDRPDYSTSAYTASPYYQWLQKQGMDEILAKSAATGNLGSGTLGTALVDYAQNVAQAEYSDWYNRQTQEDTNQFNRLLALAGYGQTSAQQIGSSGSTYSGNTVSSAANTASSLLSGNAQQNYLYNLIASRMSDSSTQVGNQILGAIGVYNRNNQWQNYLDTQNYGNEWNQMGMDLSYSF